MFDIKNTKSFMDSVHGYIRVPKYFVQHIIDTPEFQRLRNVDQTGMKILYPAAKHDRFSHSLGVFHLGSIAVDALLENFQKNPHWNIRSDNSRYIFWAKNKVLFLLACLLHDVAHTPFSHSLERFYDVDTEICLENDILSLLEIDLISEKESSVVAQIKSSSPHEKVSAHVILSENGIWRSRIKKVLDDLEADKYPEIPHAVLGEHDAPLPVIHSKELNDDIQFIARMIMGAKYSGFEPEQQIRNCFIELLNGSFDVDKLDYTVRDTKMSGISNITLDIERLLNSLTIIPYTVYSNFEFDDKNSPNYENAFVKELTTDKDDLVVISGTIDRGLSLMDGQVDIMPDTSVSLKLVNKDTSKYLSHGIGHFYADSVILQDPDKQRNIDAQKEGGGILSIAESISGTERLELINATVCRLATGESKAFAIVIGEAKNSYELWLHNAHPVCGGLKMNAKIKLINGIFSGTIRGKVKSLVVLHDDLKALERPPEESRYTAFSLGYKKQAINLISNVTDARNYLYTWIYSHHKVVYYANYLIIELSRISIPTLEDSGTSLQSFLTKQMLDKDKAYLLDEDYIHGYIHRLFWHSGASESYKKEYMDFCSRSYRTSLFKSLAEFDLTFFDYDKFGIRDKLDAISSVEPDPSDPDKMYILSQTVGLKYGKINRDIIEQMDISDIVSDIIWVGSKPSTKPTKPSDVIISFSDSSVITTMDRLPILNQIPPTVEQDYYFYLYFDKVEECRFSIDETKEEIKKAFLNFMDQFKHKS